MNKTEIDTLLEYIKQIVYEPEKAHLDYHSFSPEYQQLAKGLAYLGHNIQESQKIALALANGEIDSDYYVYDNVFAAPLKSIQSNLRHLAWAASRVTKGDFNQKIRNLGSLSKAFDQMTEQLKDYSIKTEEQLNTDYLTGVGNRRMYNQTAQNLWKQKQRFTIAFIDIDGLKVCNDTLGHVKGDAYILSVCRLLQSICRENEFVFRIGGDEFLLLSKNCSEAELERRLEAARHGYCLHYENTDGCLRDFSYGCVEMDPDSDKTQSAFLSIADQKMYNFKTIHYLRRMQHSSPSQIIETRPVNSAGLNSRIFDVFANTSQNSYMYICNMDTNISRWSLQAVDDFGLPGEYMFDAGNIWVEYIHPDDRDIYLKDVAAVFSGQKRCHEVEYRAKNKDGNYVVCSCTGSILKGTDGKPDLFAGVITNHGIIDNIDPVTNLYNIYEFLKQLRRIRNERRGVRLLCVGINQFATINTAYGYSIGNQILNQFAKQLLDLIRGNGQVFRLDGVKFVLLIQDSFSENINSLYKKIMNICQNSVSADGAFLPLEISGAFLNLDRINVGESTIQAELMHALSISKKEGLGRLVTYNSRHDVQLRHEIRLLDFLRQSVFHDCKGFYLVYQPQVDINGRVIGVEALLRWYDKNYGEVPPGKYIPFLENDSCFYKLGLWIMKTALSEMKPFLNIIPDFMISVNISYRQIEHYGFRDDVMNLLRQTHFPPCNLTLELTEHCHSITPDILKQDIRFFQTHGIHVSADDFGTGHASISLMRELPFNSIKIDRSFIFNIPNDDNDQIIVEAIIKYAKKLGIKVCVEGIETPAVLDFIKKYNAEYYQGYLFAKPMSSMALYNYIETNHSGKDTQLQ